METDDYRDKIQNVITSSEDHFEQKLTFISAGALGLSLTFIEEIIPLETSIEIFFLLLGWGFLVLTLLLNLISHMVSKHFSIKSQIEYDKIQPGESVKELYSRVIIRNKRTDMINWITIFLLVFGISLIVVFTSLNSINKKQGFSDKQLDEKIKKESISTKNATLNLAIDSTSILKITLEKQ